MSVTVAWIARLLDRDLEGFARELELFPDDDTVWGLLPGVSNSAGTLALHVCGNLQHFVGAVLGGSAYVRDRPLEFSQRGLTRAQLGAEIAGARRAVAAALERLDESRLAQAYPLRLGELRTSTGLLLLHLATHLAHHLGQAGYLRRVLTGDNRSSGVLNVTSLAEPAPGGAA